MKNSLLISNGRILTSEGQWVTGDVVIEDGRISRIGSGSQADEKIDAKGGYVLPGLIDLHTHGIQYESPESETLDQYAAIMASRGATTFYLTLFSPPEVSVKHLQHHRKNTDELRRLPQIAGFRLESPYLIYAGGGATRDICQITPQTTEMLLQAGGGHIKIWDISPDLPGAVQAIQQISSTGVVCSIAHTRCTIEQARLAVDAGARLVTHLFDTFEVPTMTDPGVYPAGLVDYLLTEDRVCCEIIGVGTHVYPLLVEKAFRCKTSDRLCFVTDSNYGAGLAPGKYFIPGWDEEVQISDVNNGVRLVNRDMGLAGSALTPIDNFRNIIKLFKKDLAAASHVCSRTQARLLGLNKGELSPGKDGDIIILDESLELTWTIISGRIAYQKA